MIAQAMTRRLVCRVRVAFLMMVAILGAVLAVGSVVARAEVVHAELARPGAVAAYAGLVAFSDYDPDRRAYTLVFSRGGRLVEAPVSPRSVPFDVRLGPGPEGQPVAVYSRCRAEPPISQPVPQDGFPSPRGEVMPDFKQGEGCDLYLLDLQAGIERRVPGASTTGASEFLPAIWRNRIAFVRRFERRPPPRDREYIYTRRLDGSEPSVRIPGSRRGTPLTDMIVGPTSLALYGRNLAFAWNHAYQGRHSEIRLVRLDADGKPRRRQTLSHLTRSFGPSFLVSPSFDRGVLSWGEWRRIHARPGEEGGPPSAGRLFGYRLATGRRVRAVAPPNLYGVATTQGRTVLATASKQKNGTLHCQDWTQSDTVRGCRLYEP